MCNSSVASAGVILDSKSHSKASDFPPKLLGLLTLLLTLNARESGKKAQTQVDVGLLN